MQCDLIFRFLKYVLPEDTIIVGLKVCTLKCIHIFRKDYMSQTSKCSPWGAEVHPYPALRNKMTEFMHRREASTIPYTNKTYQSKLLKTPRKRNLIQLTSKPNRNKLVRPRKVNVQKIPFIEKRKFPTSTISNTGNQLDWKSKLGKTFTQEALNAPLST